LSETRTQGVAPLSADQRPSRITLVVAALITAASVALFFLIAHDLLDGAGLVSHDDAVLAWFVEHRTDWMISVAKLVSTVGSFASLLIIGAVLGLLLWRWGVHLVLAAAPVVALSLSGGAATIAKAVFDRERPPVSLHATTVTLAAFPSGHAADAAGFFLAAALTLVLTVAHKRVVQLLYVFAGVLCAAAVGISRLVLAVHWLSDVVAGWALGTAIAIAVVTALWFGSAPSAGFEPAHPAPEADALSPELRGRDSEG
jgi:membrane-associated phospholipid phosphatase